MVVVTETFRVSARADAVALDPPVLPPYWPPGAIAVRELTVVGCRWPLGEVADETFRFCGELRVRGSYCAAHRKLAYVEPRR